MNKIQIPLRELGVVRLSSEPISTFLGERHRPDDGYIATIDLADGSRFTSTGTDCVDALERVSCRVVEEVGS